VTGKAAWRGLKLAVSLFICFLRFGLVWLNACLHGRPVTTMQRAEWMRFCGRTVLSAMDIESRVEGTAPTGGILIVANHLSYLDIVIASAAVPSAFVAKSEIADWPGFGTLARLGGTIFVNRISRVSAWQVADRMAERLAEGVPVLFFPEGTSTDGSDVTRFHSTLFAAAVEGGLPVTPAAIFYEPPAGLAERDLCWFGDDLFFPHLLRVLGITGFTAVVRFGSPEVYPDRNSAAWRSHDAVVRLRSSYDFAGAAVLPRTTRLVETRNSR
jgi:lyso-ornithine lipid O-acyltransferase